MTTRIEADWAIYSKTAGSADDYRVLRAGGAYFSRDDYDAILRRFVPGTPPTPSQQSDPAALPWVTISYAPLPPSTASAAGSGSVLGIALCTWTNRSDAAGRPVSATTYLCAPFARLAAVPVSYQSLYRTVRDDATLAAALTPQPRGIQRGGPVPLLEADHGGARPAEPRPGGASPPALPPTAASAPRRPPGGSLSLEFSPGFDAEAIARRLDAAELNADGGVFRQAAAVAALLLCQPVALLGPASSDPQTRLRHRLWFLDTVAALLPYGQRSRLVASTWADSGSTHRIRLAFTNRARPGDAAVHLGGPRRGFRLPPLPHGAAEYFALLLELRERRKIPAAEIIRHLAEAPYRPGHHLGDPEHALLSLADLPGPRFFTTRLLVAAPSGPASNPAAASVAAGSADLAAAPFGTAPVRLSRATPAVTSTSRAVTGGAVTVGGAAAGGAGERSLITRELVSDTVALIRAQRVRRRLLSGPSSALADDAVLGQLAAHPGGPAVALELVRRAVEDDLRLEAGGRGPVVAGTIEAAPHTAGWLGWLTSAPSLGETLRPFTGLLARRHDAVDFDELAARGQDLWQDSRYSLAAVRLARLTGQGRALAEPLWTWLTTAAVTPRALSPAEKAGWAEELHRASGGDGEGEARLDFACLLLDAEPVEPLRDRMTTSYRRAYRSAMFGAYHLMVDRYGRGIRAVRLAGLVMDGLAASLERTGWPYDPVAKNLILELLTWMVESVHWIPPRLRIVMNVFVSERGASGGYRHGVDDKWLQAWPAMLTTYVDGPTTRRTY
ncbi:conserved hypothetical protein [Frankia sp. AiPs1]|uniref:hypothetical protein n=1 Tax=Frankia sp. AiPa1 TaxID=573492 RepID=UPI00202B5B26|nr:hypothetical protein [Frankia sp. AiPa1]MCL9760495.1 hypothetical protein [Frankia sp. AiPa1]